ncbi:MAG: 3-hydroxyacyl-CoA dehydrogenase NAD-binding domain-containing protein [Magnetococcus sp. YQC-5]
MDNTRDRLPRIWQSRTAGDGLLWLVMDDPGRTVNLLSREALAELFTILRTLQAYPPSGLVITSGKPAGFIAGADVAAFEKERHPAHLMGYVRQGHEVMDALAALPFPTVAVVRGHCLGGGLELALACRYRVVVEDPATRLGLPEVQLGIHPGFGGTVRLSALIGHASAMSLMLSGRTVSAREAVRLGLADTLTPLRQLESTVLGLLAKPPKRIAPPYWSQALGYWPIRPLAAWFLRRSTASKAPEAHYPAPHALIDLWQRHAGDPASMMIAERESVARLAMTGTARQLTRLFFLREQLKGLGKGHCSKECRLHVVGAGVMGGDIAAWCALKGMTVTVQDASIERLGPMFKRASLLFARKAGGWRQAREAMDRLIPDPRGDGVAKADVVIEAISENLAAKQALLSGLEPRLKPDALLATNTSALSLDALASVLQRPERLVGLHFFNPVEKMQLLEVVSGPRTSEAAGLRGCAFAVLVDRLPLPVRDGPGFLINRLLMPYLQEAVLLAEEGVSVAAIDAAARGFGMPMGPLLLADQVGLDIVLSVAASLSACCNASPPDILKKRVAAGHLGKKSGQGFYHHVPGKQAKPVLPGLPAPLDVVDRLFLPMANAAVATLREGIVADADWLDAAMVYGAGFAPFRGGPLSYVRSLGREETLERLQRVSLQLGQRLVLDVGWQTFPFLSEDRRLEKNHEQACLQHSGRDFTPVGENVVRLVPGTS